MISKEQALANHLGIDVEDIEQGGTDWRDHYEADGYEWRVLTDGEADEAAEDYIRQTLWAFNADFVVQYIDGYMSTDALRKMQQAMCEDANDAVALLVRDNLDDMIADAIQQYGRGAFLSGYDHEEIELNNEDGLVTYYAYRQ